MEIIISLFFVAGILILQFYLTKMENKWIGLILPTLNLLLSMVVFSIYIPTMLYGGLIYNVINIFLLLLIPNIPTIALLLIYFIGRRKMKSKSQEA